MFTIDNSLTDLKVKDRNIFKILYSMNSPQVATPELSVEEARCYVLFFSEQQNLSAYIGLYLPRIDRKIFYAYTSNPFPFEAGPDVEVEATGFAEDMGFLLDEISVSGMPLDDRNRWIEEQYIFGYKKPEQEEEAGAEKAEELETAAAAKEEAPAAPLKKEPVAAPAPEAPVAAAPTPARRPAPAPEPEPEPMPEHEPLIVPELHVEPDQPHQPQQPIPTLQPMQQPQRTPPHYQPQQPQQQQPQYAPQQGQPAQALYPPKQESAPPAAPQAKAAPAPQPKAPVLKKKTAKPAPAPPPPVEEYEEEVPVETESAPEPRRTPGVYEEALKEGVVRPPKQKTAKAARPAGGVVPRDREALARLLSSF